jgi:hypothetical protein
MTRGWVFFFINSDRKTFRSEYRIQALSPILHIKLIRTCMFSIENTRGRFQDSLNNKTEQTKKGEKKRRTGCQAEIG